MKPHKVKLEITAGGYVLDVLNQAGEVLWQEIHILKQRGFSEQMGGCQLEGSEFETLNPEIAEALSNFDFGPFNMSNVLLNQES